MADVQLGIDDAMTSSSDEMRQFIKLDQFLKVTGMVGTGGEAKMLIQAGEVMVNGEVETRRGRKLVHGDLVGLGDEELMVEFEE